jgi:nucleoid DNA-binding protein
MQNRDKILQEVAKELGHTQKQVREVVSSQAGLVRRAIQNKETTSVYLRKVGTFISRPVREEIQKQRIARTLAPTIINKDEDPLIFN